MEIVVFEYPKRVGVNFSPLDIHHALTSMHITTVHHSKPRHQDLAKSGGRTPVREDHVPVAKRRRQSAAARLPTLRREEEVMFELVDAGDLDGVTELLQVHQSRDQMEVINIWNCYKNSH